MTIRVSGHTTTRSDSADKTDNQGKSSPLGGMNLKQQKEKSGPLSSGHSQSSKNASGPKGNLGRAKDKMREALSKLKTAVKNHKPQSPLQLGRMVIAKIKNATGHAAKGPVQQGKDRPETKGSPKSDPKESPKKTALMPPVKKQYGGGSAVKAPTPAPRQPKISGPTIIDPRERPGEFFKNGREGSSSPSSGSSEPIYQDMGGHFMKSRSSSDPEIYTKSDREAIYEEMENLRSGTSQKTGSDPKTPPAKPPRSHLSAQGSRGRASSSPELTTRKPLQTPEQLARDRYAALVEAGVKEKVANPNDMPGYVRDILHKESTERLEGQIEKYVQQNKGKTQGGKTLSHGELRYRAINKIHADKQEEAKKKLVEGMMDEFKYKNPHLQLSRLEDQALRQKFRQDVEKS